MSKNPPSGDDSLDGMSAEVDRLLKKLPGADPMLRGSGATPSPLPERRPGVVTAPAGAAVGRAPEPTAQEKLGVWLRTGLAVLVGALMTQWPYAHACGWSLSLYLAAVAAVTVAGGWGSVFAWRHRMGAPHVLSVAVVFWGMMLAALQVLPRIGYAAASASWRCL